MSLKNKVVIVTGASSGIGAALALEALREGAEVTAVGRNKDKLEGVVAECERRAGRGPLVVRADVTDEAGAARVIADTLQQYGRIDVLVNNAGIVRMISIEDAEALATYDSVMKTNVRAVIHLTQLAIPHLEKTKGNIVNISSVASTNTYPISWAYCMSKAALDHFSRNMAVDLAPKGIRVNTVNPGPVVTDFVENMGLEGDEAESFWEVMKNQTLLNRISDPKEVADLVVFLASDKAIGVTGSRYVVDNGYLLK